MTGSDSHGPGMAEKMVTHLFVWVPLFVAIGGVVHFWGWGIDVVSLCLFVAFVMITGLGVTAGFHRLFTHPSYSAARPIRFLLAVCGSMAAQMSLLDWVAGHGKHHHFSDRDGDPHSPHLHAPGWRGVIKGFYHAHMGWFSQPPDPDAARYTKHINRDPMIVFVSKYFVLWVALGLLLPALIGGLVTLSWSGALLGFIWGGVIRLFFVYHVTWSINSICHIWGTREFETDDESRNNPILGVIGWGEGYHNNHHALPMSARHGIHWWQIDMTWYFIWTLEKLGLAWNVNRPTPEQTEKKKKRLVAEKEERKKLSLTPVAV